ncbi:MAG: hypothetical protein ABW217_01905 [Polyangiaceae bacterium]
MSKPTEQDLQRLAEPTRSTALDQFQRLIDAGHGREEAAELAFRQAEEWEASRAPQAATPGEPAAVKEKRTKRSL